MEIRIEIVKVTKEELIKFVEALPENYDYVLDSFGMAPIEKEERQQKTSFLKRIAGRKKSSSMI